MVKLKLRGMRAVYDEIITQTGKRGHAPEWVVGDLLTAQLAEVESRTTAYSMSNAKLSVLKTLAEFDLITSPVNAAMVRDLYRGNFLTERGADRRHGLRQNASGHCRRGELRAGARGTGALLQRG